MFGVLVSIIGETNVPVDTPEMANRNRQTANSFSKELWRDILMGQHGQSQAQKRSIGAHSHAIDDQCAPFHAHRALRTMCTSKSV